jgi:hypothetical protein
VEAAVAAAELAASATPAHAPYLAYKAQHPTPDALLATPPRSPNPGGATPRRRTPPASPAVERALDFAKTAGALDAVVRHATRTTARASAYSSALELEPSAEEYALAITKLEGRKEALFERYAAMELEEGRVARVEDFDALEPARGFPPRGGGGAPGARRKRKSEEENGRGDEEENGRGASETAGPSKARARPAFVPKLALGALAMSSGSPGEAEAQTEARAGPGPGPGREEADEAERSEEVGRSGDAPASSPRAGAPFPPSSSASLVATPPRPPADSPRDDPSPERVAVARLARECAVLEGRIKHRVERRAAEANERRLRRAARHFVFSLERRALLAWITALDEAHRRRRVMRKAAARMRLRLVSAGFEAWCEFARLRAEARAERRMRFLEAKAEAASKAEAEAVRAREEAAGEARRAASAVEAAEAREREARNAERRAKETPRGLG